MDFLLKVAGWLGEGVAYLVLVGSSMLCVYIGVESVPQSKFFRVLTYAGCLALIIVYNLQVYSAGGRRLFL